MSDPNTKEKGKSIRDAAAGRGDIYQVDPDLIDVTKGFNPRDYKTEQNKAHIQTLAKSILKEGVQEPLWVTFSSATGRFTLINGESRLRAVRAINKSKAGTITTVPVIRKTGEEAELLALAMTANTGKPFSLVELGTAFKRLVDFGWDHQTIAERWGMTTKKVEECILLTDAEDDVKSLMAQSAVTPAFVVSAIKKHGGQASLIIKSAVAAATADKDKKPKKEEPKPDTEKTAGTTETTEPAKRGRGRPKGKKEKVKPVTRAKKKGGEFIKDDALAIIRAALTLASASTDVNISTAAQTALEKLPAEPETAGLIL